MIINLTYHLHPGMFKYPSDSQPELNQTPSKFENEKYSSARLQVNASNHHGTHIDAPFHKLPGGKTIDQYPNEKFENYAYLLDLSQGQRFRPKREITPEDLEGICEFVTAESQTAIILYTGFCDEMQELDNKLSPEEKLRFEKSFPYLSQQAANYLCEKIPNLNLIGIDSFAIDPQGSNSEVHRIFFEKDILPIETLFNLRQLREFARDRAFLLRTHPEKTKGADAGRTIATAHLYYG